MVLFLNQKKEAMPAFGQVHGLVHLRKAPTCYLSSSKKPTCIDPAMINESKSSQNLCLHETNISDFRNKLRTFPKILSTSQNLSLFLWKLYKVQQVFLENWYVIKSRTKYGLMRVIMFLKYMCFSIRCISHNKKSEKRCLYIKYFLSIKGVKMLVI